MSTHTYQNPADIDAGQTTTDTSKILTPEIPQWKGAPAAEPALVKKTRKPPKPGPVQRRPEEPHRIPLNVGLLASDKMKLLRVIARDHRLTDAQKVVAIPLVDNVNSEVGHSFISWDALGRESDLGWQAAKGAADRLKGLGYVNIDHIQGGVVHMSLNLDKIDTPKPDRKRTLSRDEAREKAEAKKAGDEMYGQTSPSQRHVDPVAMCSETSPEMCRQTSGEMYGATSGGMYGQTSKSEIPLRDVIRRSSLGEGSKNNGAIDADAPPPSLCPRDASLKEEPASPKGVPLPGYDSKTFAGHLPSFATTWPADPHPEGVDGDEVDDVYDLIRIEWAGKEGDARKAVAKLMVIGWTADQLRAPMEAYNERLDEMDNHEMLLIAYLGQEFDLGGKHMKAWEAEKAEMRHQEDKAPAIIEKAVAEHQVEHQVVEHQVQPVTIAEPAEPAVEQPVTIEQSIAPAPVAEACADYWFGDDEPIVPLTEEQKARHAEIIERNRAFKEKMKANPELFKHKRVEDSSMTFWTPKPKPKAETKPATTPASTYPLSVPKGMAGGLRRLSDYADDPF